jgi:hypothetical protein
MEDNKVMDLIEATQRLEAVTASLEAAAAKLTEQQLEKITAVDASRESDLERRLAEAESRLAELTAVSASQASAGRKTLPANTATMLAKQGQPLESSTIDAALASLGIEQRIAVKAELLRAGLLG